MGNRFIGISILGILISFGGGFFLSNSLNRDEISDLKTENARLKKDSVSETKPNTAPTLSNEEIKTKIAEAEQNKDNFSFQKRLGIGLYRYAVMKQDKGLLTEVSILLERANKLNSDDYDVLVALGDVYFDIGRSKKQNETIKNARSFYRKALEKNKNDVNVRKELGMTYFHSSPPEYEKAIVEFKESLKIDGKHEKTLVSLIEVLIKRNSKEEASKYLETLKKVNPANRLVNVFTRQLGGV